MLAPNSNEPASLWAKKDGEEFLIASLTKDKPHVVINLFISLLDKITLINKGKGTIHLTGFFELDNGEGEEFDPEDLEDQDEESE